MGGEGFAAVAVFVIMPILAVGCIIAGLTDDRVAHPGGLIGIGVAIIVLEVLFIVGAVVAACNDSHDK